MDHIFTVKIGDFSGDGHDRSTDYYVRSNKPLDDVHDAWFAAKEKWPLCCPTSFCKDYDDNKIRSKTEEALKEHDDVPMPYDLDWVTPDDMIELTLWFLRKGDPELQLSLVKAPSLVFCGTDSKGREFGHIGYGCFY